MSEPNSRPGSSPQPTEAEPKPVKKLFLTKAEQEELARKAKARRKEKARQEALKREQELAEEKERQRREAEEAEWNAHLQHLVDCAPVLRDNPWIFVQNPITTNEYLMSLVHLLSNFVQHNQADEFLKMKAIVSIVKETLADLARFARVQPAFYITHPDTIRLCVEILFKTYTADTSETSTYAMVLNLMGPTIERPHLFPLLNDADFISALLLGFTTNKPIPTDAVAAIIYTLQLLASSDDATLAIINRPEFARFEQMAQGSDSDKDGFSRHQQTAAQVVISLYRDKRDELARKDMRKAQQ